MFRTVSHANRLALFALTLCTLIAGSASATDPRLSAVTPQGAQRGTEVDVVITGSRLEDATELLFDEPGLRVASLAVEGANVKARLAIEPDCRLGIHALWLRTESGISDLKTFHVGALPETSEVEPNSEFDAPQAIPLGTVVNGVVTTEDVDYFQVEAKKGQRISVEVEGLRLGRTFFDPYIAIIDVRRFELTRSDDSALLRQDGVCSVIAPEDGKYIIELRESAFGGDGNCTYRLHVGTFPRPTAVFPAGGRPGEKLQVRWLGDPAGERTEEITIPTEPQRDFAIYARDDQGVAPSGNVFRIVDVPNTLEAEPNNDNNTATAFVVPGAANGIIGEPGDIDRYKFTAIKGQALHIRVIARELRSPLDSVLGVRAVAGANVGSNDDNGGPDSYFRFSAPEDGEYIITVYDHLRAGGPEYVYRVEVTPIAPELSMSLPERERYVAMRVAVPKGNRTAVMVGARRADFGGDLDLDMRDLPTGVTIQSEVMAANRNETPVLLEAAADAAPAGGLVDVVGKPVDDKVAIEGRLSQLNSLVRGQNNREVWGYTSDRMALAVTKEVPCRIDIVQPKVPLVQGGSMQLKVVAMRAEGFTAAIPVRMLYNPPGVSSSASIVIAEGQTEAVIPLTAAGNAEVRNWKIAVLGRVSMGGNIEISTQLADLEVAAPFFGFAFRKAATEQGQDCDVIVNIEKKVDFEGPAKVELVGLPGGATTEPVEFTKDSTQMVFEIKTDKDARVGRHATLICRAVITKNGEPITHTIGTGELRIDQPLPPKPAAIAKPAPKPEPKPEPAEVVAKPQPKPLSRLEKLRQERAAAKAAAGQ
jgi:hypothetical protein